MAGHGRLPTFGPSQIPTLRQHTAQSPLTTRKCHSGGQNSATALPREADTDLISSEPQRACIVPPAPFRTSGRRSFLRSMRLLHREGLALRPLICSGRHAGVDGDSAQSSRRLWARPLPTDSRLRMPRLRHRVLRKAPTDIRLEFQSRRSTEPSTTNPLKLQFNEIVDAGHGIKSSTGRWVTGNDLFDRETELKLLQQRIEDLSALDFSVKVRAALDAANWRRHGEHLLADCAEYERPVLLRRRATYLPEARPKGRRRASAGRRVPELVSAGAARARE